MQLWVAYDDNGCFFIGELVFRPIRCLTIRAAYFWQFSGPAWGHNGFRLSGVHGSVAIAIYCVQEIMVERSREQADLLRTRFSRAAAAPPAMALLKWVDGDGANLLAWAPVRHGRRRR